MLNVYLFMVLIKYILTIMGRESKFESEHRYLAYNGSRVGKPLNPWPLRF